MPERPETTIEASDGAVEHGFLAVSVADAIATITLTRPPINAVTAPIVEELRQLVAALEAEERVRAVVLTGGVRNAFCSGGDLEALFSEEMRRRSDRDRLQTADAMQAAFRAIELCTKPVVAAINGVAFGAGLELALVCDVRVASELAYFALPELGHQIIPGLGGTLRLAPVIGLGRAKEMAMLGRRVRADEALAWGLVHRLAPHKQTLACAQEVARTLAAAPAEPFAALKRAMQRGLESGVDFALREETREFARLLSHRLRHAAEAGR